LRVMKAALVLLWVFLVAGSAIAYIPPASFLMEKMAAKRGQIGLSRVMLSMKCRAGKDLFHEEQWYIKSPGMVRREKTNDVLEVCNGGQCWQKKGKEKPVRLPGWSYWPYLFIAEGNATASRYLKWIQSVGVNVEHDTLTRFHGQMAVILGAKEWERDRPQFWIDKDVFLPLRLMVREGASLIDILWIDWGSRLAGDWFPSALEIYADGQLIERCEVVRLDSNRPLSDDLFRLPTD
jgi:hypothetical protein